MEPDIFPGEFVLDEQRSQQVRVSFAHGGIFLSDGSQRMNGSPQLHLDPCSQAMLFQAREVERVGSLSYKRDGHKFRIGGTRVGDIKHGPLGHPGDGEFEVRPITAYDLTVHCDRERLGVEIAGRTERGFYVCYFARTLEAVDLKPWTFEVRFAVERAKMPTFLNVDQESLDAWL